MLETFIVLGIGALTVLATMWLRHGSWKLWHRTPRPLPPDPGLRPPRLLEHPFRD